MDQDDLNLNMVPGFSENLISYKQSPGDFYGFFESNEFPLYNNQDAQEIFEDCYHKVFNPFPADNKKNILTEINEISNIEDFIVHFQKQLDYYYYEKEFDIIIEIIEKRFPYFFNEKTNRFLFIIQKLKFFELLRQDRLQEAKLFYKEKLVFLLKEIKKENWEKKNKFFMQLINNPKIILKRGDLQKKYYDQYSYELEKAIRIFLHDDNEIDESSSKDVMPIINNSISISNSNLGFNHLLSSSSIDLDSLIKNNNNIEPEFNTNKIKDEIIKEKSANEEEKEDLDIENFSTKEEFSDFEDEIQQKCVDVQDKKENNDNFTIDTSELKFIDKNNIYNNSIECEFKLEPNNDNKPDISSPFSSIPSKSFKSSFIDIDNNLINFDKNEFIINTSSKNIQKKFDEDKFDNNINEIKENTNSNNLIKIGEINTNINIIQEKNKKKEKKEKENKKKYENKKKNKKEETIYNQLPFLSSFKPKYIKRETIDKKIIRSFKNYVIKEHKSKRFEINSETMDQNFFISLINGNVLPPLNYHDLDNDEYIKFNSFNCSFLLWFFGKKGIKEIYNQFINEKGKEFIYEMSQYYEIPTEEEKNQLNSYIMNLPNIFDISLVNNITQGANITHLYRTVDKNKILQERQRRKKNDLDLKRLKSNESQFQRERSRSRDFENSD